MSPLRASFASPGQPGNHSEVHLDTFQLDVRPQIGLGPIISGLTFDFLEDVGWDQVLPQVSTNASGQVVSFAGFDVQEYQVFGGSRIRCGSDPNPQGPCNSWISGFFCGPGGCANDDGPLLATGNVAAVIDALANDIGFADPVTVTITAQPSQAAAQVLVNGVSGNSGNQADIRIAYTANVGASATDRFTYQVSDGVSTASATVSLSLDAPTDVSPSIEIWGPDEPPLADVVADQGNASPAFLVTSFIILGNGTADQHVVTVTSQATGGICAISPENGTGQFIYTWSEHPWQATLAGSFHTGWPTTPVTADGIGPRNSARFKDYSSLDVRVSRDFSVPRGDLTVFAEATNALDRRNPCCVDYSLERGGDGSLVLEREYRHWLPLVPSVGVLWKF